MNPNRSEDIVPPGLTAADLGESSTTTLGGALNDEWSLISYLTQPLLVNSRQDYAVITSAESVPVSTGHITPDLSYRWTVTNTTSKWILHEQEGEEGVFNWIPRGPGGHEVKVVVTSEGTEVVTLALTQQVQEPPTVWQQVEAQLEANSAPASQLFAMREICLELHDYIVAAAETTGANGVPPLFVAAVMFMEAWGRPKDGSPGADAIRRKLAGESGYWPRRDAAWEKLQRFLGEKKYHLHLHDIREVELDLVREFLNETNPVDRALMGAKSLGVGQIAMTTTAMVTGDTEWTELSETNRKQRLDQIEAAWSGLGFETKVDIFNALRFPKQNAWVAANLLAKIKNRSHRFPGITSQAMLSNSQAIDLVATEYNRGAYDTELADMKGNSNGRRAKQYVLSSANQIGLEQFY
jgi:hypothetical protein